MSRDDVPRHLWQGRDGALLMGTAVATLMVAATTDLFEELVLWAHAQASPELEEVLVALMLTGLAGLMLLLRIARAKTGAETELEAQESSHRSLLAHLPVGTYRTTPDGTICEANPAAAYLFGFDDVATLLQHNARDLYVDGTERDMNVEHARDGEQRTAIVRLRHRDGRDLLVRDHVRAVRDAEGRVRYFDGVLLDVTEQERIERALRESEERYRLLVEQSPLPLVVHDGTTILFANAACAELVGADEPDELVGEPVMDFIAAPFRAAAAVRIRTLFTGTAPVLPTEIQLCRLDGSLKDVELHSAATTYHGRMASQVILHDVTEKKKAARRIRELKAFYENVLNALPTEVAVLEPDGRYLYLNPAAVEDDALRSWMIGKTPVDYARRRGLDPTLFEERVAWIRSVADSGETTYREEAIEQSDGTTHYVLRAAAPAFGDDGTVQRVIAFGFDITDRKHYEQQLRTARDEAEELSRLKSTFLANMSHEVRTPLTGIIGFATVLEEELQSDEHREVALLVRESGQRLLETLNSVLDYARLEAGAIELETHCLDLVHEICETAVIYRSMAERDDLTFDLDVPAREVHVEVDPNHLRRILANLFSNAVKFTDEGGVTVRLEADEDEARLHVRDTGSGIDEDFLPHLFQEFRQESSGLARRYPGSGLGLAITRRLVEHMDGRIDVQSEKGQGSTFTIVLPRAATVGDEAAG